MKLIFATGNENKMREIREIMGDLGLTILSMKEAGIEAEIEENGTTFRENALIKARSIAPVEDAIVMADDSGLSIAAFDGGPGVYSSRFLGTDTPYPEKNRHILSKLEGVKGRKRKAWYTCAVAVVFPDGEETVTEGRMYGRIAEAPAGENGFGYDPIFFVPEAGKTAAEMEAEEKNALSHRGKALKKAEKVLCCWLSKRAKDEEKTGTKS